MTTTPTTRAYVEHVAIRVRDIGWHIRFFRDVLGMPAREVDGPADAPRQYWSIGGLQFIADARSAASGEQQLGHIGLMVDDVDAALAAAARWPEVRATPAGAHWLRLPEGLVIELLQASPGSVARALAVDPRSAPAPRPHRTFDTPERFWENAQVGDECLSPEYLVTAERIDAYAELTGDFTPVHVDEAYARASHFGQRVAHGLMGLSVADGLKTQSEYRFLPGMSLGWTWDFRQPIHIGDTLRVRFRIGSLRASSSRPGWGIVVLPSELINQRGEVVQQGEHRLMVPRRPATP